jgi:hypothetical protein
MYRPFFGLRERPFDLTPNPRFLVLTDAHREALSNLEYGVASRRGITLLIGEAGTGKTTIIRTALERQPDRVHSVHLHNPSLRRDEFVEMLAVRFGLTDGARRSKTTLLNELEALMRDRNSRGESTVLIIDEAQSLPLDLLEEIRLLANIETNDTKLLSVVLAGQPELATRLNDDALRQVHAADSFLRKTGATPILPNTANVCVALFSDHHETPAAAANADNAPGFHDLVQPARKNFRACLRFGFLQPRPRADQAFQSEHSGNR